MNKQKAISVMVASGILGTLDKLCFSPLLLTIGITALYCYGAYCLFSERQTVAECLGLIVLVVLGAVPYAENEEGDQSPYPARPTGLNRARYV